MKELKQWLASHRGHALVTVPGNRQASGRLCWQNFRGFRFWVHTSCTGKENSKHKRIRLKGKMMLHKSLEVYKTWKKLSLFVSLLFYLHRQKQVPGLKKNIVEHFFCYLLCPAKVSISFSVHLNAIPSELFWPSHSILLASLRNMQNKIKKNFFYSSLNCKDSFAFIHLHSV